MNKKYTITQIIFIFIVLLIAVQSIVYISMFHQFDIENKLKSNDISAFYNNLHARSKFLDSLFNDQWSNLNFVNGILNAAAKRYDLSRDGTDLSVDSDLVYSLINMNENMRTNGSYIILKNRATQTLDTFVISDLNPVIQTDSLSDIVVEMGDKEISDAIGLEFSSNWRSSLNRESSNHENSLFSILDVVESNAKHHMFDTSNWGYWSELKITENSPDSISYCIPLISKKTNEFYGVVGVIIQKEYLLNNTFKSLYFNDQTDSFSIAKRMRYSQVTNEDLKKIDEKIGSPDSIFFKNILTKGSLSSILFNNEIGVYQFEHSKGDHDLYNVMSVSDVYGQVNRNNIIAIFTPIKLYGANSSFIGDDWYFINYVHYEDLFAPTNHIVQSMYQPIVIIILAEIIFLIIISSMSLKELNLLISNIKILAKNPNNKVAHHSKIYEVDQIFKTIQNLNLEIVNFSSKMEQIIESTDIKIGAVEIFKTSKDAIITGSTADLLGFDMNLGDSNVVSKNYFNEKFQDFISASKIFDSKNDKTSNKITITYEISNLYYNRVYGNKREQDDDVKYITVSKIKKNNRILYIIVDETEKIQNIIKIRFERDHDSLTGLLNGKAFKEKVQQIIDTRIANGAMIMWDLDNLKYINDTYGHNIGDEYIKETANIIMNSHFKNFVASRIAGDEFYAFTYNFISEDVVLKELDRIREKLNNSILEIGEIKIQIHASTGISWFKKDSNDVNTLIKYADFAMYHAKKSQKGTIREFDISKYNSDFILSSGNESINKFIENKELQYVFQPIISLKNMKILGYEAFMRPTSGNIKSPYGLIRMAKSQSRLDTIEKMTWMSAIEEYSRQSEKSPDAKLFINSFSNISLSAEDMEFLKNNYGNLIDHVVMEIIDHEHLNQKDEEKDRDKFQHMWSCKITLDDFSGDYEEHIEGICRNSNYMKIDMSIIRNIDIDIKKQNIFKKLTEIAHKKQIEVISEGVETEEELSMILKLGSDYAQGFFIAFPEMKITNLSETKKIQIANIIERTIS